MKSGFQARIAKLTHQELAVIGILLALPAFLLNLGMSPIIGDEGIRTLVALEMKLSGNFIVPTMNGELYLNKPPLYNWFIFFISELMNDYGEWPSRCLTLFFLMLFAITVYYWNRKHGMDTESLTLTFMLLSSGRILFWDSMYGLIDICFSWVVYLNMMLMYHYGKAGQWNKLMFQSYLLCAIAFLLKGLPALVFQSVSILFTFWFYNVLHKYLFSWKHFIGALMGMLPVMTYYLAYMAYVPLDQVFGVLFEQSMQRTATHHGLLKTLLHFITFPFEQIYHFLPWSLMILLLFQRNAFKGILENQFIRFNAMILLANIPVYWLSVEVYPRYLLMFIPLFNSVVYYLYVKWKEHQPTRDHNLHQICKYLALLLTIASMGILWYTPLAALFDVKWIFVVSFLLLLLSLMPMWNYSMRWIFYFALFLLSLRIVFDITILPVVSYSDYRHQVRTDVQRLDSLYPDQKWYVFDSTETHMIARFYTSKYHNQIITQVNEMDDPEGLYIVDPKKFPGLPSIKVDSLIIESGEWFHLVKKISSE